MAATGQVVVDNPLFGPTSPEEHRHVTVARALRGDPLAKLHHARRIDDAEYRAGRRMQAILEQAEVGRVRSQDPSREPVDGGGHIPDIMSDGQLRALKSLTTIYPLLGKQASAVVVAVVGGGRMPEEYARSVGLAREDDIRAMGRVFKWALGALAKHLGYAS